MVKSWSRSQMRSLAEYRGIIVKKITYVQRRPLMILECQYGHEWEVKPGLLKGGEWCQKCVTEVEHITEEQAEFFEKESLQAYSLSKIVKSYRKMTIRKLRESFATYAKRLRAISHKVIEYEEDDEVLYYPFRDRKVRAWYPMLEAIAFVLLERKELLPLGLEYLLKIKEEYLAVKDIKRRLYETDEFRREGVHLTVKASH